MKHPLISKIIKEYSDYYHAYWELKKQNLDKKPGTIREKYLHNEASDILNDLESLKSALDDHYYYMFSYAEEHEYHLDYYEDDVESEANETQQEIEDDLDMINMLRDSVSFGEEPTLEPSEIHFLTDLHIDPKLHLAYKVSLNIQGFSVTLYGLTLNNIGDEISFVKALFNDFSSRAKRHFPDLLNHKVPVKVAYGKENHSADAWATYIIAGQTIVLNMRNMLSEFHRAKEKYVKVLSHEMAHHYYFTVLNSSQRQFWLDAIKADYKPEPLADFLHDMSDRETLFTFISRIKRIDPLKHLQMKSIKYLDNIGDLKKNDLLDPSSKYYTNKVLFNKNPVSEYGSSEGPEEAFAEVIGYILGFGTNSILPQLFERMRVIIPNIKLAKENPMQNRIASLERRLASLEHVISVKTAGSHVKLPSHELAELTHISDKALDHAYHYGMSKPGSFGYKANEQSVLHAIDVIATGNTNIEAIADAVHKGWSHAFFTVKDPAYKDPTIVDEATGLTKGQKKYNSRLALAKTSYRSLSNDEKEKDRVVARAVLAWAEENGWVGGLLP